MMKNFPKLDRTICVYIIVIAQMLLMAMYIFGAARYNFHSDDAIKTVLANIAAHEGTILPTDWVFANGDIPIASPYIFSVILANADIDAYNQNALSVFLGYVFFVLCYWGFCRQVFNRTTAALSTILVASGLSLCNLEYIIAQGSYSFYAGLALCVVGLIVRNLVKPAGRRSEVISGTLAALATLIITLSNPSRVAAQLFAPIFIAWGISFYICRVRAQRCNHSGSGILLTPAVIGVVVGLVVGASTYYLWLLPHLSNFQSAAKFTVAPIQQIVTHIKNMPSAWVDYQLANPQPGASRAEELLTVISWIIAVGGLAAALLQLLRWRTSSRKETFVTLLALGLLATPLVAMAISDTLFFSYLEMRYTVFADLLLLPIFIANIDHLVKKRPLWPKLFQVAIALYAVSLTFSWGRSFEQASLSSDIAAYARRQALLGALTREGVNTAVASYWNSHVLTVLSNNSIHVNPVSIDNMMRPYAHHSYRGSEWNGSTEARSAVVLTDDEATAAILDQVHEQLGNPAKQLSIAGYHVDIYDFNVYDALPLPRTGINEALPPSTLGLELSTLELPPCRLKIGCSTPIGATNSGTAELRSYGKLPLRIGIHAMGKDGSILINDAGRADFLANLKPGQSTVVHVHLGIDARTDVDHYQLCLVQDGASWYCDKTKLK
jgi:hypothetical protein